MFIYSRLFVLVFLFNNIAGFADGPAPLVGRSGVFRFLNQVNQPVEVIIEFKPEIVERFKLENPTKLTANPGEKIDLFLPQFIESVSARKIGGILSYHPIHKVEPSLLEKAQNDFVNKNDITKSQGLKSTLRMRDGKLNLGVNFDLITEDPNI